MRALFLLLLLANLLFAAWVHWVAPPRVTTAGRATPSATEANEIRLLREAQVSDGSGNAAGSADLDLADDALACVSAGPYLEQQLAARRRPVGNGCYHPMQHHCDCHRARLHCDHRQR